MELEEWAEGEYRMVEKFKNVVQPIKHSAVVNKVRIANMIANIRNG